MPDLKYRQEKIQEKRKQTDFRDFVKEITSWTVLNLYKHNGKVCRYPNTGRVKNLDNEEAQNAGNYFLEYNFKQGLFENFKDLFNKVPQQLILDFGKSENSEFADAIFGTKDSYLSFVTGLSTEKVLYSVFCYIHSTNIYNSFLVSDYSNNVYFGAGIFNSFNIFYSKYINDSSNIWFCTNMIGCQECIFCNGLQNKKYYFQNKQYKKEEFLKIKKQLLNEKDKFSNNYISILKNKPINYLSEKINGEYNIKCNNVENGYWIKNTNNSRNVIITGGDNIDSFYDSLDVGVNSENFYGVNGAGNGARNIYSSTQIDQSSDIYYSYFISNCSFCLGCIGLKNKQFCILNKQYSKEERYVKAEEIFRRMEEDGILGEFFPGRMNPFYFNDTAAYLIDDSFTKEEVEKEGYMRRDEAIKVDVPEGLEVVETKDLGNYEGRRHPELVSGSTSTAPIDSETSSEGQKRRIDSSILDKVIREEKGNYYRIVKMEYDFLMKHGLPLPRLHWLDRIKLGFKFK